jgi:UDP-glucose 4-epimerase
VVYDAFVKGHAGALDPAVPVVRADIAETERLRETMERHAIEAVIHMAGLIEVGLSVTRPEAFFDVNVAGSVSVVRAMVAAGVKKLVFSSTAALYGDPERLPITEDEPTLPTNPYGESKLMVERMLAWVAPAHGLVCTVLRYFNAAGATERSGEDHEPETHLIPLVLRAAADVPSVSTAPTTRRPMAPACATTFTSWTLPMRTRLLCAATSRAARCITWAPARATRCVK